MFSRSKFSENFDFSCLAIKDIQLFNRNYISGIDSWTCNRCTREFNPNTYEITWIKNLKKVKRKGYKLEKIIMIDDTPEKLSRNYGNLVRITPFEGNITDKELLKLQNYLSSLALVENIRKIEKRGWSKQV